MAIGAQHEGLSLQRELNHTWRSTGRSHRPGKVCRTRHDGSGRPASISSQTLHFEHTSVHLGMTMCIMPIMMIVKVLLWMLVMCVPMHATLGMADG